MLNAYTNICIILLKVLCLFYFGVWGLGFPLRGPCGPRASFVSQTGLNSDSHLPLFPECWDSKHLPPLTTLYLFFRFSFTSAITCKAHNPANLRENSIFQLFNPPLYLLHFRRLGLNAAPQTAPRCLIKF